MNFNHWFNNLQTRTVSNPGAGLVAFRALLEQLGNPQTKYKVIHVAGTNGKGTVCTLLAHTLSASGAKTGLFISPHLVSATERIQIDGEEIAPAEFISVVEKVLSAAKEPMNLFEVLTAAALVFFAEKQVQYAVLETGLGGRKDPTNICMPVLSIITSVGLDHTHLLGDTLAKIAAEKAGIIKPGVPVLCGELPSQALRVVEKAAREKNAPLQIAPINNSAGNARLQNIKLVSYAAGFLGISEGTVCRIAQTVQVPGRFEVFSYGNKTVILDGAHNPAAMENLLAFWQTTPFKNQRASVLCAFMRDKDYPALLAQLGTQFPVGVVTQVASLRAAGEAEIAPYLPPGWEFVRDPSCALNRAWQQADTVLCTGSFYLVGQVYALLKNPHTKTF